MSDAYYLIRESGAGCDYSIECGTSITQLHNVNSMEEAIQKAIGDIDNLPEVIEEYGWDEDDLHDDLVENFRLVICYQGDYEDKIHSARIIKVCDEIDLSQPILAAQEKIKKIKKGMSDNQKEDEDRIIYEELKRKFESK